MDGVSTSAVDLISPPTSKSKSKSTGDTSFADLLAKDAEGAPGPWAAEPVEATNRPSKAGSDVAPADGKPAPLTNDEQTSTSLETDTADPEVLSDPLVTAQTQTPATKPAENKALDSVDAIVAQIFSKSNQAETAPTANADSSPAAESKASATAAQTPNPPEAGKIPLSDVIAALRLNATNGQPAAAPATKPAAPQKMPSEAAPANANSIAATTNAATQSSAQISAAAAGALKSQTSPQTQPQPSDGTQALTTDRQAGLRAVEGLTLQFVSETPTTKGGAPIIASNGGAGAGAGAASNASANAGAGVAGNAQPIPNGAQSAPLIQPLASTPPPTDLELLIETGDLATETAIQSSDAKSTQVPPTQALTTALRGASPAVTQVFTRFVERFDGRAKTFEVRLDPPELGKVDVKVEIGKDNKVQAVLAARDPAALADLMKGARALEAALAEAGVDLAEDGLDFQLAPDGDGFAFERGDADTEPDGAAIVDADTDDSETPGAPDQVRDITPQLTAWRPMRFDMTA